MVPDVGDPNANAIGFPPRRQIEPERIACPATAAMFSVKIHVRRQRDGEIETARRVAGHRHGPERGRADHSGTGPRAHSV
jgi:hypothetical protein